MDGVTDTGKEKEAERRAGLESEGLYFFIC